MQLLVHEMMDVHISDKLSCEGEKDLISIKTDLTCASDSCITDLTNQWNFGPATGCHGCLVTEIEYLDIPEGITRIPFRPLPEILLRSVPVMRKSMNYYQKKAAKYQPISPNAKSNNNCPKRFMNPGIFSPKYQCSALSKFFSRTNIGVSPRSQPSPTYFAPGLKASSANSPLSSPRSLNYYQKKSFLFEPPSKCT
jgi:hypothetical protein